MLKFKVDTKQNVIPDISVITIPKFKEVVEYGKKNNKEVVANRILLATYFLADTSDENIYRDIDPDNRQSTIMHAVFGRDNLTSQEAKLLTECIDTYMAHNETSADRVS